MRVRRSPRIIVDSDVRHGKPTIERTRVPVDVVIGQLAAGLSIDEVMDEYAVSREDVLAALAYAADILANETVRGVA